ncbi:MAG TPA: hypothetical protein VG477_16010, partial [Thermoanaerobaculia bacterium]|nr:hypothetical protein [Thermoanaerobaculia bacterium]
MISLVRLAIPASLLILVSLVVASTVSAQTASLVKDIWPGFRNHSELSPGHITVYKNGIFFQANEPSTGRELWSDDGTGTGPRLLADLCPGECSSTPRILGVARSLLFGLAVADHQDQATLWRTDGTRQGTLLLPPPLFDIYIPFNRFNDEATPPVILARDSVYFTGCRSANECSLWRSDGTLEGTRDLAPGASGVAPVELAAVGNLIFFSTYKKLWVTDGTVAGTVVVKEFAEETPRRLAALGSKLMFLAADPTEELWISDGTATGTRPVTSLAPEHPFQQTSFLKALDGRIYFVVDDITHGAELWSSDGTPQGT